MAARQSLPETLSPAQVIALQDALLENADRLLRAAITMLDNDEVALARSLAILGMEESGKAIALHERRVGIAYAPEGEAFVDKPLRELWGNHGLKLSAVYDFLVAEQYWFGVEPSDPAENERALGTIDAWRQDHNTFKQGGFYVDVSTEGDPIMPGSAADSDAVRDAIGHIHQVGWQLRLGEHIEGKRRRQAEEDVPPASDEEIARMRRTLRDADPETAEHILESMRQGSVGERMNNAAYAFVLPKNPFENLGKPGYEAEERELALLMDRLNREDAEHAGDE